MFEPFTSARALTEAAQAFLIHLQMAEQQYFDRYPGMQLPDQRDEEGWVRVRYSFSYPIPISLAVLVFQVVQNLRSALDHAAFDASRELGGNPRPKFTKFPFGKTKKDLDRDLLRKKSEVPEQMRRFFAKFRPYQRGNRDLWALNELRNSKIHKTLAIMSTMSNGFSLNEGVTDFAVFRPQSKWNAQKRELLVMKYMVGQHTNIEGNFSVAISLGADTPFKGQPAVATLARLTQTVADIVSEIETHTATLKT